MDERIPLVHSYVPADVVSTKNLTLLALLFADLQLHHPTEGPLTTAYCCNNIS